MSLVSDPELRAASQGEPPLDDLARGAPPTVYQARRPPARRSRRARLALFGALGLSTVILSLRLLASIVATTLERVPTSLAPTWTVEVTSAGPSPTTAIPYGPDVGIQLVRVPAGEGTSAEARTVPARLARGEVHLVALGLSPLRVHARPPQGRDPITFDAEGRLITAFESSRGIGVRTPW